MPARRLIPIIFVSVIVLTTVLFLLKSSKSKESVSTPPRVMSNLFVYEDPSKKEPSFSIKLPDGWFLDLKPKGNERLVSLSQDKENKGITYRAAISGGIVPTKFNLASEVTRARKDISAFSVDHKFIADKSIKVKGYPSHLLEYNSISQTDTQNVKEILGEKGLIVHHVEIITVKDGYFIDVAAYTYDWAWPEFITVIEKSLNTLSFTPDLTTSSQK